MALYVLIWDFLQTNTCYLIRTSTEKKPDFITEQYKCFLFVTDALQNFNMNLYWHFM